MWKTNGKNIFPVKIYNNYLNKAINKNNLYYDVVSYTMNYTKILMEFDFEHSANKADLLFYQSLRDTISLFGKHISESFLKYIFSQLKISDSFSVYYDRVKKELIRTFGEKASDIILTEVKENIQGKIGSYSNKQIREILDEIKKEEMLRLIQNLNNPERVLLLWKTEGFKDQFFYEFFNRKKSTMLFFSSSRVPINGIKVIPYEQILEDTVQAIQKEIELTNQACQLDELSIAFVGAEDMTNWFRVGLADEFLKFRRSDSNYFKEKPICRLCGLDINQNIDEETIRKTISSFNTVMIEDPISTYKRKLQ